MRCKVCGANCRCKKTGRDICCPCHPHKAARSRYEAQYGKRTFVLAHKVEPELELELGQ